MKKLFIFMAALFTSAASFAQQPVKQAGQLAASIPGNNNLPQPEAQQAEQFLQMQQVLELQNGTLPQERVLILPTGDGAIKPYLIMHK